MEKEAGIIRLKKTRKAFIIEYACGLFLLGISAFIWIQGTKVPKAVLYLGIAVGAATLVFTEISRNLIRYKITSEKVIITKGIIRKHKKNIYFHPLGFIPDINAHQSLLQRFLNYGTVFIKGAGENQLEIKDIDQPEKILNIIEKYIDLNRMGNQESGKQIGSKV